MSLREASACFAFFSFACMVVAAHSGDMPRTVALGVMFIVGAIIFAGKSRTSESRKP